MILVKNVNDRKTLWCYVSSTHVVDYLKCISKLERSSDVEMPDLRSYHEALGEINPVHCILGAWSLVWLYSGAKVLFLPPLKALDEKAKEK